MVHLVLFKSMPPPVEAGRPWALWLWGGAAATVASAAAAVAADLLAKQFSYCYTRERQERELARIPKLTAHLQRGGGAAHAAADAVQ
jgi:hypothetical protein